jgi:hypothetical protein
MADARGPRNPRGGALTRLDAHNAIKPSPLLGTIASMFYLHAAVCLKSCFAGYPTLVPRPIRYRTSAYQIPLIPLTLIFAKFRPPQTERPACELFRDRCHGPSSEDCCLAWPMLSLAWHGRSSGSLEPTIKAFSAPGSVLQSYTGPGCYNFCRPDIPDMGLHRSVKSPLDATTTTLENIQPLEGHASKQNTIP